MAEDFLRSDSIPSGSEVEKEREPEREPLRMMLIGSRERVMEEIPVFSDDFC